MIATDDAVKVPDQVTVIGPTPYTDGGSEICHVCPDATVTDRAVTACPSNVGIGSATVADADDGPMMNAATFAPVGHVSTAPVVGNVMVSCAPACGGDWIAYAVIRLSFQTPINVRYVI